MTSEESKAADNKTKEGDTSGPLSAGEVEASKSGPSGETDAFQCGKCKQHKTKYWQAQTRSVDEPMTTFVHCLVCDNHWKFS